MRIRGIVVDFRRILRLGSEFGEMKDYLIDNSVFGEGSILGVFDGHSNEIYERCEDGSSMIVKRISGMKSMERLKIEVEQQLNLSHPCILGPIGFIFDPEARMSRELKIVKLYSEGNSLSEVISQNPVWWTATAKAKAIAGIVLSLRFAHSFGLIHGHLSSKTIVFDLNHRIEITDFYPNDLENGEGGKETSVFSDEGWSPDADIRGFASILFEAMKSRLAKKFWMFVHR
jgi:serine/threonine protein kinase